MRHARPAPETLRESVIREMTRLHARARRDQTSRRAFPIPAPPTEVIAPRTAAIDPVTTQYAVKLGIKSCANGAERGNCARLCPGRYGYRAATVTVTAASTEADRGGAGLAVGRRVARW